MTPSPYLVMAKPAGAHCNLACAYCYYLAKGDLFPGAPPRMPEDLLEAYIRQRLEGPGPATHFEWHGGEPTLLGLDYFRRIVALQQAHRPPDRAVSNGLQTNGTLLDEGWARFLARETFSVGLSLDGPAACHDAYRLTRAGQGSHADAARAFRLLKSHGVHVDVLCVLHAANAGSPLEVYQYFRDLGVTHLQFLPLTRSGAAAQPGAIGEFLCRVFDQWVRNDLGRVTVQNFDEAFRTACGLPHALCTFRETCGDVLVLEHEGSVFSCDHFVDPAHRLGNLRRETLAAMAAGPAQAAFGTRKRDGLAGRCRACDVLAWCNGGCPKDRFLAEPSGEAGVNVLCPDYRRFFRHCGPVLKRLAAHWKAGRPLREFARPAAARGNDPCPCGSGRKFKRCCRQS